MSCPIGIRRANCLDARIYRRMRARCIDPRPRRVSRVFFSLLLMDIKHFFRKNGRSIFLTCAERPAGFFTIRQWSEGLIVEELGVLGGYRNRGIGNIMMHAIINHAKSVNARTVSLGVEPDNAEAIYLYKKYGLVKTEQKGKISIMSMTLADSPGQH